MINYTIHPFAGDRAYRGRRTAERPAVTAPQLTVPLVGQRLALDTTSAAIPGPCELRILPDEEIWLDIRTIAGDLNPATSPLKLAAGGERVFEIPQGQHFIRGSAA